MLDSDLLNLLLNCGAKELTVSESSALALSSKDTLGVSVFSRRGLRISTVTLKIPKGSLSKKLAAKIQNRRLVYVARFFEPYSKFNTAYLFKNRDDLELFTLTAKSMLTASQKRVE